MKFLLFLSLTFVFAACSGSKSTDESMDAGIELADAVEFTEESEDVIADALPETLEEPLADPMAADAMAMSPEAPMEATPFADAPMDAPVEAAPIVMGGEVGSYTVKENETLMMIAFNIYGDYAKWREIASLNQDQLGGSSNISQGMVLKYNVPAQPFVFNPSGNPYLIVRGDTLGKVSQKTYGQPTYWKNIWDNNRPLIKDPNVIFAGFTIYTPIIEGRDVAFDGQ